MGSIVRASDCVVLKTTLQQIRPRIRTSIYRGHPRGGFPLLSAATRAHDIVYGFNSTQAEQQYEQEQTHNRTAKKKDDAKEHQREKERARERERERERELDKND